MLNNKSFYEINSVFLNDLLRGIWTGYEGDMSSRVSITFLWILDFYSKFHDAINKNELHTEMMGDISSTEEGSFD